MICRYLLYFNNKTNCSVCPRPIRMKIEEGFEGSGIWVFNHVNSGGAGVGKYLEAHSTAGSMQ